MPDNTIASAIKLPNEAYLLPHSIAMWPPVWWTWLVLITILLALAGMVIYFLRRHKKRAYRREALSAIDNAESSNGATNTNPQDESSRAKDSDKDDILLCHEMIRRCLISENKIEMAALPSTLLLEKIDLDMPQKHQFSRLGEAFFNGPYQQTVKLTPEQRTAIFKTTRYWIRKHRA